MWTKGLGSVNLSVRLAWKKEGNMVFYAVDVRDRMIQRVTQQYNGVDKTRFSSDRCGVRETGMGKSQPGVGTGWQRRLYLLPPSSL